MRVDPTRNADWFSAETLKFKEVDLESLFAMGFAYRDIG
jgi:hypothetical protein